jgi:hypothetical protein
MFPKGIVWYENCKMEGVFDLSDDEVEIWWFNDTIRFGQLHWDYLLLWLYKVVDRV